MKKDDRENELFIDEAGLKQCEVDLKEFINLKIKNDKVRFVVSSILAPISALLGASMVFDFEKTSGIVLFSVVSALLAGLGTTCGFYFKDKIKKSKQLKKLIDEKKYEEVFKQTKDGKSMDAQTISAITSIIIEDQNEKRSINLSKNFKEIYKDL